MFQKVARQATKTAIAGALYYSGALGGLVRLRPRARPGRVHVLSYHRVVEDFSEVTSHVIPALCISRRVFRRHLELIAEHFEPATLEVGLAVLAGRYRPRREVVVVTFDDAYRDVHAHALPELRALGIPAAVFVPTGYVGSRFQLPHDRLYGLLQRATAMPRWARIDPNVDPATSRPLVSLLQAARMHGAAWATDRAVTTLPAPIVRELLEKLEALVGPSSPAAGGEGIMTWSELRDLAASGIEIGSHTVGHVVVTNVSAAMAGRELADSKSEIEANIRGPVRYFAYPNGRYSGPIIAALARLGYSAALTTEDLPNHPGVNPFALKRKVLWEGHARGLFGGYSRAVSTGHLSDVFGTLGLRRVERGEVPAVRPGGP